MFCPNCGKEIQDDFNFCPHCGLAQKENITPRSTPKVEWEVCEIEEEIIKESGLFSNPQTRLIAKAVGPKGIYIADFSETVRFSLLLCGPDNDLLGKTSKNPSIPILNSLVSKLTTDGWQPIEAHGKEWFSYKFRRPVSK